MEAPTIPDEAGMAVELLAVLVATTRDEGAADEEGEEVKAGMEAEEVTVKVSGRGDAVEVAAALELRLTTSLVETASALLLLLATTGTTALTVNLGEMLPELPMRARM